MVTKKEWEHERQHFSETLSVIDQERQKAEDALGMKNGEDRLLHVQDDLSNASMVELFTTRMKLRQLHQLRLSQKNPYFARVDFTPTPKQGAAFHGTLKEGEKSALYIGRWGIIKTPEYHTCVADWRSPVANLYYSGQVGPVCYEAPDGFVEGFLSLKRMFSVEDGQLLSMQDTGLVGQEQFLTDTLSQISTTRLREVVNTIQAEQNLIIRSDPTLPLCVQGVAGSGKTTIALHRIAWILYRLQKDVAPHQLMIVAPSPLFLNYISRVLPDLGVNEVRQTTFYQLCQALLKEHMPRILEGARLSKRLSMQKTQRDALDYVLRQKGALSLAKQLDAFIDQLENQILPSDDLCMGKHVLFSHQELKDLFLQQLRHFPLQVRIGELKKAVITRVKKAATEMEAALRSATEKKLNELLHSLPDGPERRTRATRLFNSRDERMKQLKILQKETLKRFDTEWPRLNLLNVYASFWKDMAFRNAAFAPVWAASQPLLKTKKAATEDLPALLWLAKRLYGFPLISNRHIIIDEAQDVSPLQVLALRTLVKHDAFTLVGDLWQGIYGDEGIRSWKDLSKNIFQTTPTLATLSTSYRSTIEIMQLAFHIIRRHPTQGVHAAEPVLRHGKPPCLLSIQCNAERPQRIAETITAWQAEGYFSIAVIVKQEKDAHNLYKALFPLLPEIRLITHGDDTFVGGLQVMDSGVVKGLEFDCVLVADANNAVYPDERFYAKLLYVLCTRPLHRLALMGEEIKNFIHCKGYES